MDNLFAVGECLRSQAPDVAGTLRESIAQSAAMTPSEALLLVGEIKAAIGGLDSLADNLQSLALDALSGAVGQ